MVTQNLLFVNKILCKKQRKRAVVIRKSDKRKALRTERGFLFTNHEKYVIINTIKEKSRPRLFRDVFIEPVKAGMIAAIEPVAAAVFFALWLGTSFTVIDIAGFAMIISAVIKYQKGEIGYVCNEIPGRKIKGAYFKL